MTARSNVLVATPEQIDQAQAVLEARTDDAPALLSGATGGPRPLPAELASVMEAVLQTLARGGSFTIETMPKMLTTTQAARLLGVSRPTLMKRIACGELSSTMVGTHHRIRSADVIELRRRLAEQRHETDLDLLRLEDEIGL